MNRVVPPAQAGSAPSVVAPAAASFAQASGDNSGASGEQAAAPAEPALPNAVFLLNAVVYDHQITELRWTDSSGPHHVFANFDFNYVASLGAIRGDTAQYILLISLSDAPATGENDAALPPLSRFPAWSAYLPALDNGSDPAPDSLDGLTALAVYFDDHREALVAGYAARLAAISAASVNAAPPQNLVINVWPIRNNSNPAAQGAQSNLNHSQVSPTEAK